MKIVINKCYGGFDLSEEAIVLMEELMGSPCYVDSLDRTSDLLVYVVEHLGVAANSSHSELKVVDIPDGVIFDIEEYDGIEKVVERHRTWY
jgi:hypothetical protein